MSEAKIVVPREMLDAATQADTTFCGKVAFPPRVEAIVEAALRWLSENPIVPTDQQLREMLGGTWPSTNTAGCVMAWEQMRALIAQWQRRAFLAPRVVQLWIIERDHEPMAGVDPLPSDVEGTARMKAILNKMQTTQGHYYDAALYRRVSDQPDAAELRQITLHEAAGAMCIPCKLQEWPQQHLSTADGYFTQWLHKGGIRCPASEIHDLIIGAIA